MEEQQEYISEQNNSMEELKMEEDEYVKEISMEDDILGAQSLLLSESDEDLNDGRTYENKKSPQKKIGPKTKKRILDSDNEDDGKNKLLAAQAVVKEKLPNKEKTLIDSDSVVDKNIPKDEEIELPSKLYNEIDSGVEARENSNGEGKLRNKKISALIDSDSDIDNNGLMNGGKELSTKLYNEIDSDMKDRENAKVNFNQLKQELKNSKLNKKKKELKSTLHIKRSVLDSDSPEIDTSKKSKKKIKKAKFKNNSDADKQNKLKETKKNISLVDSESSDDGSDKGNNASDLEASARDANFGKSKTNLKNTEQKLKVVRASATKAIDEMKAIQSEQQRLHREAHISIPYHKPRKHTLDEFLKRRTVIQPQLDSPVAATIQTKSLKMTPEELEEYAKLMEERAKEATEFFKSESENEEEMVLKDNEGVFDKPVETTERNCVNISMKTDLTNKIEMQEIGKADDNITNMLTENIDDVQLTEEELAALLVEEEKPERPMYSKVLITEVIELPKLDMNTVRLSPFKKQTPRSSLNFKKLLAGKNLSESPSLSGDPNKLIDLETGDLIDKKPTGMENLMKRLMASVKLRKSKTSESCNILSVENGKLEMSKVNISRTETKDVPKEAKPGAAYFELKNSLFQIIKKKRMQELTKKQEDELEYSKCLADDNEDNYDIEEGEIKEISFEDEIDGQHDNKVVMVDEDENGLVVEVDGDENGDVEISGDEEDVASDDEQYDYDESKDEEEIAEENYDDKITESVDKSQRKSRIIKAFDDTDEEGENDDIDFLKTQPPTTQPSLLETQTTVKTSLENEENELMTLCSGTFDETQKTFVNALMSQIPITQNSGKLDNDEELMKLCSGTFDQPSDTPPLTQSSGSIENLKTKCNKILSSDEESDEKQSNSIEKNKQRTKKLTKKLCKRKPKLGFSEDEDEEKEEEGEYDDDDKQLEELDDNMEINTEDPETFVDYDSEENEILVQLTKKDKVKQAQHFVENEAELSESEWGSADEDENNLDKYDIELGDEDEFDKEKLRTELGQIHARKMLDEDIRAVRKIKEMLFEDEEKDGVGRERTFKWKNAESGFSLDDRRSLDETGDGQKGDSGDEMNEHQWRKIRYEREQFLREQGIKLDSQDISTVLNNTTTIQLNNTAKIPSTAKQLQIIATKKTVLPTSYSRKASSFLISNGISTMHRKSVRSSFLVRDKDTLSKLAGFTKGTSSSIVVSEMDDTAGTVSIKSIKAKNFVFATLTEEEHENLKRKADDLLNSSNENGINFMKKPKTEPRRNKCFIDQLL